MSMKFYFFIMSVGCMNFLYGHVNNIEKSILIYEKCQTNNYIGEDSLSQSYKSPFEMDIYVGANRVYIEWSESNKDIDSVVITNVSTKTSKKIYTKASDIGHTWQGVVFDSLDEHTLYTFQVVMYLNNSKRLSNLFSIYTKERSNPSFKRSFRIYDDLEGKSGKSKYLKRNQINSLAKYGLQNSQMYWVDDFFKPNPSTNYRDTSRLSTELQHEVLQALIKSSFDQPSGFSKLNPYGGLVVLDIEHLPTIVSYVDKEFVNQGRVIVCEAIAKKLHAIKTVKMVSPHLKVGIWDGIVNWNRYHNNEENIDHVALAKGSKHKWLFQYKDWHEKDVKLYSAYTQYIDYVMPSLYPAFDLDSEIGKNKQLAYMKNKLFEIKRINPDIEVIASISPHYTEGWADKAGYNKMFLAKSPFTWYLNTIYDFYHQGLIDSIEIWGDNTRHNFDDYINQPWWNVFIKFAAKHALY